MTDQSEQSEPASDPARRADRLDLVIQVVVFQFKLAADGLRDLLLSPLSVLAGLLGLVVGGDRPDRYLVRLMRFGRRTERWINLFGHGGAGPTADTFVQPFTHRLRDEVQSNPWLSRADSELNRALDSVNDLIAGGGRRPDGTPDIRTDAAGPTSSNRPDSPRPLRPPDT